MARDNREVLRGIGVYTEGKGDSIGTYRAVTDPDEISGMLADKDIQRFVDDGSFIGDWKSTARGVSANDTDEAESEDDLMRLTKSELLERAKGLDITEDNTKSEIAAKILNK